MTDNPTTPPTPPTPESDPQHPLGLPEAVPRRVGLLLLEWNTYVYALPAAMVFVVFGLPWKIGVLPGFAVIVHMLMCAIVEIHTHQGVKQKFRNRTDPISPLERRYTRYETTFETLMSGRKITDPTLRARLADGSWWAAQMFYGLYAVAGAAWMLRHTHSVTAAILAVLALMALDTLGVANHLYLCRNVTELVALFGRLARYHRARNDPAFAATYLTEQ